MMFSLVLYLIIVLSEAGAHDLAPPQLFAAGGPFRSASVPGRQDWTPQQFNNDFLSSEAKETALQLRTARGPSRSGSVPSSWTPQQLNNDSLSSEAKETEINKIRINNSYDNNTGYKNFPVWWDQPLQIVIENCYARIIWCYEYYTMNGSSPIVFLQETKFSTDIYCVFNITKVTAEMNTKWNCTILKERDMFGAQTIKYKNRTYAAKYLIFNVNVKGVGQVHLTVNGDIISYTVATNQSFVYDGNASYVYADGEDVELSCQKSQEDTHNSDTLRLEYYNAEGKLLFKTEKQVTERKFRSIMKSTNNEYYIDCIRASTQLAREYRHRTTFYVNKDAVAQSAIIVSVNGQNLTAFSSKEKSYDNYKFRYIQGENLNVTCQINKDLFQKSTLKLIYGNNLISPGTEVSGFKSVNVTPSPGDNRYLTCNIKNTDADRPNARVQFLPDVPEGEVRVYGLPRNNILYQYTTDLHNWTIEYQYSVNEELNLTCVANRKLRHMDSSNPPRFQWRHSDRTRKLQSSPVRPKFPSATFSNFFFIRLYATYDGTKIKCIYIPSWNGVEEKESNLTVEIILRLKPKVVPKDEEENREETTSDPDSFKKDPFVPMIVPIACAVGVIVAIITVICLVCWRKRTKRLNLIENNYDSFSNEVDSVIPAFPSQWESNYNDPDYAKIYEDVRPENYNRSTDDDQLYKLPYKRESNNSENHYTEIDDYFKPKPDGLAANWNSDQSSNHNKDTKGFKRVAPHNCKTAIYNNVIDTKQDNYDHLVHHNLPVNKSNENYSSVQSKGKNKSVTFRETGRDLDRICYYSEGNSKQGSRKKNNDSQYANTNQNVYMQPGDMHKTSNYENLFPHNKKTVNQFLDSEFLDDDFEIICKNELYGINQ